MTDFFATLGIFTGILVIIALGLYGLNRWHARIEKRLRPTISTKHTDSSWRLLRPLRRDPQYATISRADLDVEAAAAECGYFSLRDHILHVRKLEGRHDDAA